MPPQVGCCFRVAACSLCRKRRSCILILRCGCHSAAQACSVCTMQASALPACLPALCLCCPESSPVCLWWCQPLRSLALHALRPQTVLLTAIQVKRPPRVHMLHVQASLVTLSLRAAFPTDLQTYQPTWRRHTSKTLTVHLLPIAICTTL